MTSTPLSILFILGLACRAGAVVVAGTTGNTTAPVDNPGWTNVGTNNSAAAVYLGSGWVITAFHVNASGTLPVAFSTGTYTPLPGTAVQLTNNGVGGMTPLTDLIMFKINDPGLPAVQISAAAPTLGMDLTMIGNGLNRQASRTFWQVTMNADPALDTWVPTGGAHNAEGFLPGTGQSKRWGTNDAEAVNVNIHDGIGHVRSILSLYDDDVLLPNEAQAVQGDSGGGVFTKVSGQWYLSGIMVAAGSLGNSFGYFDNLPANSSVFEQSLTVTADLSFYRTQIMAIMVPEPSAGALTLLAAAAMLRRRR